MTTNKYEFGIILLGNYYVPISGYHKLKKKSLYDNLYFTFREIFSLADTYETTCQVNEFNSQLTNNVYLEDRTKDFTYSNVLDDIEFVEKILGWLNKFNEYYLAFDNIDLQESNLIDWKLYMELDTWLEEFNELKKLLSIQYEKLKMLREDKVNCTKFN